MSEEVLEGAAARHAEEAKRQERLATRQSILDRAETVEITLAGQQGEPGPPGPPGEDGLGVPAGGTTDQRLAKKSNADNDTQWVTPHEVPAGGVTGQVLSKKTGTDYDTAWSTPEPEQPLPIYDECESLTEWTKFGGNGSVSVQSVVDGSVAVGGKVFRAVGSVAPLVRTASLVPYDPNALYRIKYRVRQTVDGTGTCSAGLEGVAADGTTLVNSAGLDSHGQQHYIATYTTALTVAQGWREFVGYVKGTAATGTNNVPAPSPVAPGVMHQNTRYIRPVIYMNHVDGTGTQELDYVSLEIVPVTAVATGGTEVTLSGDGAGTPLSAALTGTRSGDWNVASGDLNLGSTASGVSRAFWLRRFDTATGKAVETRFLPGAQWGSGHSAYVLRTLVDSVAALDFVLATDGTILITAGGVGRPIPFAMWTAMTTITITSAANGTSASLNFPTGRFTVTPVVQLAIQGSTGYYVLYTTSLTSTAVTVGARHTNDTVGSATLNVHITAIQMTPTSATG